MSDLLNKRNEKIQLLRGLAIIAVVFIHNTPTGLCQVIFRPFLNFSVALFLFLSGLLSKRVNWNPKKRILKVIIPYLIWTLVYVIYSNLRTPSEIPFSFLKRALFADSAAMMYYIFVYIQFTFLIPLIDKVAHTKFIYIPFLITPLEIIFMRLLPMLLDFEFYYIFQKVKSVSCLPWFTFFYLGYLLGNDIIKINISTQKLTVFLTGSILIQMLEGYGYFLMGEVNCGTQLKLSSILTSTLFLILSYQFINHDKEINCKPIKILGDYSFGIYFSHIAIMGVLKHLPYYTQIIHFPFNAIITVFVSLLCCLIGKKILGRYSKYLAL